MAINSRPLRFAFLSLLTGVALSAAACGDNSEGTDDVVEAIPPECNPLGTDMCLMPWPSMAFIAEDATTASGYRTAIPAEAMPVNIDGIAVSAEPLNRWDGASPSGPLLARFDGGVSAEGLPGHADIGASLAEDSPIILLRVDTGERVPFFAEVDVNIDKVTERTLIIRPMARLQPGVRYAVGITDRVKSASGAALIAPPAFATVRDGGVLSHSRAAQTTAGFPAMFIALEAAGYARSSLVLAWDFVTASDEFLTSDLTKMRDDAIAFIGEDGSGLTFESTEQAPGDALHRYLGTFQSPSFLTNGEADSSIINRGAGTLPERNGTHPARFAAIVPACVATQPLPRPAIVFGHGIFGSAEGYLEDALVKDLAEDYCFIIIAGDFIGLTERQLAVAALAANDMNKAYWLTEKLEQSIIDFIALEYLTRKVFPNDARFQVGGQSVIDPTKTYYLGGSLGGTVGNVFMAYDPNITRGVLAVPGGNWSVMFERSAAWTLLQGAAQGAYTSPAMQQIIVALFGLAMEPVDPITIAKRVIKDPLPGVPAKQILFWEGVGDSLITNISTDMMAREMGLKLIAPSVRIPWGLEEAPAGELTSGFTILDNDPSPKPSEFNEPEDDNGTHSGINRKPAALREVEAFILDYEVINGCTIGGEPAPCACKTTTACD